MTELVTDKCPCCGTRGLNPKKIKDMCENCLETSFDQWRRKVVSLEKENAELSNSVTELTNSRTQLENKVTELEKDKEWLDNTNNEQTEVILKLSEQIEKKKYFVKIKLEEGCYYRDSGFILELSYEELNIELIYQKVQEKLREIGALDLKIVELIDMKLL